MQWLDKIWKKLKTLPKRCKEKIVKAVENAFPKKEARTAVYTGIVIVTVMLFYIIAVFDIGLWIGDSSLSGIIAGYVLQERFYPLHTFLILEVILFLLFYYYITKKRKGNTGRGFEISDSNVYGSARDINIDELKMVAEVCPKEEALGTILGQLDESEEQLITSKPVANFNNNLLVLAPPGSGKTFCIVQNSICQAIRRGESVITTDTKGELWAKTVEYARANGYTVRRFDLKNPRCSDGFDILGEMHNDDIRAKIAASIIMKNTGNDKDIHASAEEALLAAICMYQDLNDAIPPEEKTLYNAFSMLFSGASALDALFTSIKFDNKMRVAYDSYATFLQGSPNLRGNVITGLANRLNMLSSPAIRAMTSTPDIDLTLPGRKKCLYYCEMPDQHDAMRFLATLFFSFCLWDLTDYADAQFDQRLPVPVNIMLEEAYACGELPTITNALSTVRSRGISITLIAQGLSQFHILYGEEVTNTILNSCATFACLGTNTADTADLFSWMGGDATVKVKTEQHSVGEGPIKFGRNYSTGEGRQALYTGNDLRKIPFGRIFLVWQRFDPIMAYTFGINRHPEYMKGKMPKIHASTRIELSDKAARKFLREQEEKRVQEYDEWILSGGDPWAEYGSPKPQYDGPGRKKKAPKIIPYEELERMALEYSAERRNKKDRSPMLKELQEQEPIPPEPGFEPIVIADDDWESMDLFDIDPDDEPEDTAVPGQEIKRGLPTTPEPISDASSATMVNDQDMAPDASTTEDIKTIETEEAEEITAEIPLQRSEPISPESLINTKPKQNNPPETVAEKPRGTPTKYPDANHSVERVQAEVRQTEKRHKKPPVTSGTASVFGVPNAKPALQFAQSLKRPASQSDEDTEHED